MKGENEGEPIFWIVIYHEVCFYTKLKRIEVKKKNVISNDKRNRIWKSQQNCTKNLTN